MNKRMVAVVLAAAVMLGVATPAQAGSSGWTSATYTVVETQSGILEHGQHYSGGGNYVAYTQKYNWANLSVQTRYTAYGVTYYTAPVVRSHIATRLYMRIDQHLSQW